MERGLEDVVAQRTESAPALAAVRRAELRALSDADALRAALELLELVPHLPPKTTGSGLVEQQRLFRRVQG
jgi:hypothetical protein